VPGWIAAFIGRIASYLASFGAGWVVGAQKEKTKQAEHDTRNAMDRIKAQDDIAKLSYIDRRRLLNKWVSGVQTDTTKPE